MKKMICITLLVILPNFLLANCASLMKKYEAPDPAAKTINQIKRWVF